MKKLIVFSVIFALLVSAVFAETKFGGSIGGQVKFANGDSQDTNESHQPTGSSSIDIRIDAETVNDEGTFGAYGRLWSGNDGNEPFGQVWWKPLDIFKVTVGFNRWGDFGSAEIVRWDFYADAGDNGVASEPYWGAGAVYGGFEAPGLLLALTPVDGLAINLVLPYSSGELRNVYKNFMAQVTYLISGVGKIGLTFEGAGLDGKVGAWAGGGAMGYWHNDPKIYANFFVTALENSGLHLNVGLGYKFPGKLGDGEDDKLAADDTNGQLPGGNGIALTINDPVNATLGVNFWSGDFGLKARLFTGFGGSVTGKPKGGDAVTINDPFTLSFDLLPSYDLGIFKFFFSAGMKITGKSQTVNAEGKAEDVKESDRFGFHINPYIVKAVSSGGTFYAGFRLWSDDLINLGKDADGKDNKVVMNWSIPLGFSIGL